jgi:parallel beta-helix repeat protein
MAVAMGTSMRSIAPALFCCLGLTACGLDADAPAIGESTGELRELTDKDPLPDRAPPPRSKSQSKCDDPELKQEYYGGCPKPGTCQVISDETLPKVAFTIPKSCAMSNVEFLIERSHVDLDCGGNVLAGGSTGVGITVAGRGSRVTWSEPQSCADQSPQGICTGAGEDTAVHDVTVHECRIQGYKTGVLVRLFNKFDKAAYDQPYLDYLHHRNERECRMEQIDDCFRKAAPYDIHFDNVDVSGTHGNGVHIFKWVHDVTFRSGSVRGVDDVGMYLSPGSRNNLIQDNKIYNNEREGIALDGSQMNVIRGNWIANNRPAIWVPTYLDPSNNANWYNVGITIFKNAWEGRDFDDPTQGVEPRSQHSSDNLIDDNDFFLQDTGVWIGYRQGKAYANGKRGDEIYYVTTEGYNFKKFAERTIVVYNSFSQVRVGVRVQDDGAVVIGNRFNSPDPPTGNTSSAAAVYIGHDVRRAVGDPVHGTSVANNIFSTGYDYGVVEHDCTFENVVVDNFKGVPGGTLTPVTSNLWGCTAKQSRLGMYLSRPDATSGPLTGLRTGGVFKPIHTWLVGDFNADGRDDLVSIYDADDHRARLWLHLSSGTRFAYQDSFQTLEVGQASGTTGQWLAADFDGVGGDDLVYINGGFKSYVKSWHAEGVGFMPGPRTANNEAILLSDTPYNANYPWLAGDLNLDGRADLVQISPNAYHTAMARTHWSVDGETFGTATSATPVATTWDPTDQWLLGDMNGDGRSDLVRVAGNNAGKAAVSVRLAEDVGFADGATITPFVNGSGTPAGYWVGQHWITSDFDGDGRDDLILVYGNNGNTRVWRNRSTSNGLVYANSQTLDDYTDSQRWLSGRFDDDLRDDLALVYPRTLPH